MKKTVLTLLLLLGFGLGWASGQQERPLPDLWPAEIVAPRGISVGADNEVRVVVENRTKDSKVEGMVKVELVVIQLDSNDRASYFAEVEGMEYGRRREAVFTGVEAKNHDSVRLLAIVDPDKAIPEANEVNNRKLYKVWIETDPPSEG